MVGVWAKDRTKCVVRVEGEERVKTWIDSVLLRI